MKNKGQSTLEYAVVIAVVVGALLAMHKYIGRGLQGKLRDSTDQIGEQYSAGYTTSTYTTQATNMETKETFGKDADGNPQKGVSHYRVEKPAQITRSATGDTGAETITRNFSQETLIP